MVRESGSIKGAVVNEAIRLALFLVYYLALIALGLAVLAGAVWVSYHLSVHVLPEMHHGRGVIGVVILMVGILSLAGMFGLYLIKPLFSFTSNRDDQRVEVGREDCPKLFELIEDLADKTGFCLPKHVYLTTDVNACVFYNMGFWSIFFPVRKNLEIGLGLFNSTTVQEVKAILAHEFGHFGQQSMKVGSAVSITNTILYHLVYTDDFIDRALQSWRVSGLLLWRLFGIITSALTFSVKYLTTFVFRFVERGEMKLSRLMEFGADEVACRCAGTEAVVSALCKTDLLAERDETLVRPFLMNFREETFKVPDNYFSAADVVAVCAERDGCPSLRVEVPMREPKVPDTVESRVKFDDAMSTHPELVDRLEAARELACVCADEERQSAWTLIPEEVVQKVSDRYFEVRCSEQEEKPQRATVSEFRTFIEKSYAENAFPLTVKPFFARVFETFDLKKALETKVEKNPMTSDYKRLVGCLKTARDDQKTLEMIASGEIDAKRFTYDGVAHTRKTVPVEAHQKYVDDLISAVAKKDAELCSYLVHRGNEADHAFARKQYEEVVKIENLMLQLIEKLKTHDECVDRSFKKENLSDKEYRGLCVHVAAMEKDFQDTIRELVQEVPEIVSIQPAASTLIDYTDKKHNSELEFSTDAFQELMNLRETFATLCQDYQRKCLLALARFAVS